MRRTTLLLALLPLLACTNTSTVGENPGDGSGADHGGGPGTTTPPGATPPGATPPATPPPPAGPLDTKGVVIAAVSAEQHLGQVNPLTGEQDVFTAIHVMLRDAEYDDSITPGAAGTCSSHANDPSAPDEHLMDVPITFAASGGGASEPGTFDKTYKQATALFMPPLADGTPITVTFGPEVPALAGKSVTLPAVTTTLIAPTRKPANGIRELRGYTPGTDFPLDWAPMTGKKYLLGADAHVQPLNVVNCFLADSATSFAVPASYMDVITAGADPATQYPIFGLFSRVDSVETINAIKVEKSSRADIMFQLNLNP
jgi:hypothetical protein